MSYIMNPEEIIKIKNSFDAAIRFDTATFRKVAEEQVRSLDRIKFLLNKLAEVFEKNSTSI